MANQESRKWLYNNLKNAGCDVGRDYAQFDSLMNSNAESRQWCYDKAQSLGWNVGTREQFESLIGPDTPKPQAQSGSTQAAAASSTAAKPAQQAGVVLQAAQPQGQPQVQPQAAPAQQGQSGGVAPSLVDTAAAMQGDWRDSLGTQARATVDDMQRRAQGGFQLQAPSHLSYSSDPAWNAMAEQWNAGNDQFHAAMQRRLDSPSRYLPGAPQRTTQGAVEDAMGAMMSGNSRPVVLGISGMPQGGGQAADGQGTSGSLAQAAVGPRPAGYTRNESGEMVPQWELPDGTLTTSFMTVEDAQYQANQARGIMEQERKRESALHQATVAADKAIEDEIGAYAAEQRRGNDVNLWDINPDTGVNIAGVNRYFDIEGQRARL